MLRIGDRVIVTHKVEKEEGYHNVWVPSMDKAIGRQYIIRDAGRYGVILEGRFEGFPLGCLKLAEPDEFDDEEPL